MAWHWTGGKLVPESFIVLFNDVNLRYEGVANELWKLLRESSILD